MALELDFGSVHLDPLHIIVGIERCPFPVYNGLLDVVTPVNPLVLNPDGTTGVNRFYPQGGPDWDTPAWLAPAYVDGRSPTRYSAGKFTGEMRRIVQYLSGQGAPIFYDYRANRSHGVYTASDQSKWLIECSADKGVVAKPLPTCTSQAPPPPEFGYHPVSPAEPFPPAGQALEAAISRGDVIRLATSSDLLPFYERNSYFSACGWAFSASGHKLINTCWDWIDQWKRGFLFGITITESNNRPSGASLSEVQSGILWGETSNNIKFPFEEIGTMVSFDTFYGASRPPGDVQDVPVYAYYDGEAEVLLNFRMADEVIQNSLNTFNPNGDWVGGQSVSPIKCNDLVRNRDAYGQSYEDWTSTDAIIPAAPHLADEDVKSTGNKTGLWSTFRPLEQNTEPMLFEGTPAGHDGFFSYSQWATRIDVTSNNSPDQWRYSAFVPFFDREAVYLYSRNRRQLVGNRNDIRALYGDGPAYEIASFVDEVRYYYADLNFPKDFGHLLGDCTNAKIFAPPIPTSMETAQIPIHEGNRRTVQSDPSYSELANPSRLRLVASGGVDVVVRLSDSDESSNPYEAFSDGSSQLILGVWRDNFSSMLFAMNAINSLETLFEVGTGGYPTSELTKNSYAKAWLGMP